MSEIIRRAFGSGDNGGEGKGLGYRYVRDPRSENFLMEPRLAAVGDVEIPAEHEWPLGPTLDQGKQGSCVGHGITHWINAGDSVVAPLAQPKDHAYAVDIYNWAQLNDEWNDTPPAEGTSVLAGAKAAINAGWLQEGYVWGKTINDLLRWLGLFGPVVMGSLWLSKMVPDDSGYIKAEGLIDGGHCYLAYGYMQVTSLGTPQTAIKFQNSWGDEWADGGRFYMLADEYQKLLSRGHYSMMSALQLAPAPVPTPPEEQRERVTVGQLAQRPGIYQNKKLLVYRRFGGTQQPLWKADPV